jgi:hypothetical protein
MPRSTHPNHPDSRLCRSWFTSGATLWHRSRVLTGDRPRAARPHCWALSSEEVPAGVIAVPLTTADQVIDVGSATVTPSGVCASRQSMTAAPPTSAAPGTARSGPTLDIGVRTHTPCCATIAASIPTRTSRGRVTTLNKHEGSPFASTARTHRSVKSGRAHSHPSSHAGPRASRNDDKANAACSGS